MDFFGQSLCLGDRVAFVTNKGILKMAQIVEFKGIAPNQRVRLYTEGKRYTEVQASQVVKEVL